MAHPITELPLDTGAKLLLTPCPGTKDASLKQAISELKAAGASGILTMMQSQELAKHQVTELGNETLSQDLMWFHLPVEDDEAPLADFEQAFTQHKAAIIAALKQGQNLALHCKGGNGRTGLVAAILLLEIGVELEQAIAQVQAVKPKSLQLTSHLNYLKQLAAK
ncbi:phosphatase domain-containing protein [Motilimonas pumila]|uniref:Protein phosphatase n=1 Tax=Motilimonas pumila TaxID=2303987 RepID=A0A418YF04_9GAMM|nr:tyrosine-protein phosphatase [Motilimonas pumila]RJG47732.1 protein phosphatase [Motilimonas pumila]